VKMMNGEHDEYTRAGLTQDSTSWNDSDERDETAPPKEPVCPGCGEAIEFNCPPILPSWGVVRLTVTCTGGCPWIMEGFLSAGEVFDLIREKMDTVVI